MLSFKNTNRKPSSSGSISSAVQDKNHSPYLGAQATQRLHTSGSKDDIMHLAISLQNQRKKIIQSECYVWNLRCHGGKGEEEQTWKIVPLSGRTRLLHQITMSGYLSQSHENLWCPIMKRQVPRKWTFLWQCCRAHKLGLKKAPKGKHLLRFPFSWSSHSLYKWFNLCFSPREGKHSKEGWSSWNYWLKFYLLRIPPTLKLSS